MRRFHTENPNDPIRSEILKYLYEVHRRTIRSENGQVAGSVLVAEVRKISGIDRRELAANVEYLVGSGHVQHILEPIYHNGQLQQGIGQHYYRITNKGIDSIEHPSQYMNKPDHPSITITNQGGVTVVGDNNNVSFGTAELAALLRELAAQVQASSSLAPEVKTDVTADLQTIEVQLKKSKPNGEILRNAWKGIEGVVTAVEFTAIASKITAFIGSIM